MKGMFLALIHDAPWGVGEMKSWKRSQLSKLSKLKKKLIYNYIRSWSSQRNDSGLEFLPRSDLNLASGLVHVDFSTSTQKSTAVLSIASISQIQGLPMCHFPFVKMALQICWQGLCPLNLASPVLGTCLT